jgi:hypothetical protein
MRKLNRNLTELEERTISEWRKWYPASVRAFKMNPALLVTWTVEGEREVYEKSEVNYNGN